MLMKHDKKIASILKMRKLKFISGINLYYLRSHIELGTDRTTTKHHQLHTLTLMPLSSTSLRRDHLRSELLIILEDRVYVH